MIINQHLNIIYTKCRYLNDKYMVNLVDAERSFISIRKVFQHINIYDTSTQYGHEMRPWDNTVFPSLHGRWVAIS